MNLRQVPVWTYALGLVAAILLAGALNLLTEGQFRPINAVVVGTGVFVLIYLVSMPLGVAAVILGGRRRVLGPIRWPDAVREYYRAHGRPEFHDFRFVVAVGESRSSSIGVLTIFSLECYAEGFTLHGRFTAAGGQAGKARGWFPVVHFRCVDDRGGEYKVLPYPARGDFQEARIGYQCLPAIDARARELHLEVTQLAWQPIPPSQPPREPVTPGWSFVVSLPQQP